jgi:tetratricopeptide (TPR) repeat protein
MRIELRNIRSAIDWASGRDNEHELVLAAALGHYAFDRTGMDGALERLEAALARNSDAGVRSAIAATYAAWLHMRLGDLDRASALAKVGVDQSYPADANHGTWALNTLAMIRVRQERYPEAEELAKESLRVARVHGIVPSIRLAHTVLFAVAYATGNMAEARTQAEEELDAAHRIGNAASRSGALLRLARAEAALGNSRRAGELFHEAASGGRGLAQGVDALLSLAELAYGRAKWSRLAASLPMRQPCSRNMGSASSAPT